MLHVNSCEEARFLQIFKLFPQHNTVFQLDVKTQYPVRIILVHGESIPQNLF
jgi:hypothetical protein